MGAWGIGNFENDDALDWIPSVIASSNTNLIIKALRTIDENEDYIEAPECCEALCAIEIISAQKSGIYDALPDELKAWLKKPHGLLRMSICFSENEYALAQKVLSRIIEDSELKELWEESDDYEEWCSIQSKLLQRG